MNITQSTNGYKLILNEASGHELIIEQVSQHESALHISNQTGSIIAEPAHLLEGMEILGMAMTQALNKRKQALYQQGLREVEGE